MNVHTRYLHPLHSFTGVSHLHRDVLQYVAQLLTNTTARDVRAFSPSPAVRVRRMARGVLSTQLPERGLGIERARGQKSVSIAYLENCIMLKSTQVWRYMKGAKAYTLPVAHSKCSSDCGLCSVLERSARWSQCKGYHNLW